MKKKYQVNLSKFSNRNLIEERNIKFEKKKILKQVNTINSLLKSLKKSDLYSDSGAVESLLSYLDNNIISVINKRGYVSKQAIKKINISSQLIGVSKQLFEFKSNKQSTVKGVNEVFDSHIDELRKITDNAEWVDELSMRQVKNIYKMFKTEEYEKVNSSLGSTEIFSPYVTAISEQWSKSKFVDTILKNTGNINDLDLRDALRDLYTSTIKGKVQYAKKRKK